MSIVKEVEIEVGGERKSGRLITKPHKASDGGLWAKADIDGDVVNVTEVMGEWLTASAWMHVKKVLAKRANFIAKGE